MSYTPMLLQKTSERMPDNWLQGTARGFLILTALVGIVFSILAYCVDGQYAGF